MAKTAVTKSVEDLDIVVADATDGKPVRVTAKHGLLQASSPAPEPKKAPVRRQRRKTASPKTAKQSAPKKNIEDDVPPTVEAPVVAAAPEPKKAPAKKARLSKAEYAAKSAKQEFHALNWAPCPNGLTFAKTQKSLQIGQCLVGAEAGGRKGTVVVTRERARRLFRLLPLVPVVTSVAVFDVNGKLDAWKPGAH